MSGAGAGGGRALTPSARLQLAAGAALLAAALAVAAVHGPFAGPGARPELLPWVGLVALAVLVPGLPAVRRGRLDPLDPVVFAAGFFFLPLFVLGGVALCAGWSRPYFYAFMPAPDYHLRLACAYVALGFVALAAGAALPVAARWGALLGGRLPAVEWPARQALAPALVVLALGVALSVAAVMLGLAGYQVRAQVGPFDAAWRYATGWLPLGTFLVLAAVMRLPPGRARRWALAAVIAATLARLALSGSRAAPLHAVVAGGLACIAARRPLTRRDLLNFAAALVAALALGVAYGSTFRELKGSEAPVALKVQLDLAARAARGVAARDPGQQSTFVTTRLVERLDQLSALALVAARYRELEPEERRLGLRHDIPRAALGAFVPRLLWPDKPVPAPPRALGALYFRYGGSSFGLTPMGDLLRNFGPWAIVPGMLLLGAALRVLYTALVQAPRPALGRVALHYALLTQVSYEDGYATILPTLLRVAVVSVAALVLVDVWVRRSSARTSVS